MDEIARLNRALGMLSEQVVDTRRTMCALVSALGNHPGIDKAALSRDFVSALRFCGADPDHPSRETGALINMLQIPRDGEHERSLAEQLLRSAWRKPDPESGKKD